MYSYKVSTQSTNENPDLLKVYGDMPQEDVDSIVALHTSRSLHTLSKLGEGENGTVYLFNGVHGKEYAVKQIDYKHYDSQDVFIAEKVMGFKYLPCFHMSCGRSLIVMDKIEGETVISAWSKSINFKFDVKVADDFMEVLHQQIESCYSVGVIPSDLTPKNVMINENGLPVMIDFGHFRTFDDCYKNEDSIRYLQHDLDSIEKLCNDIKQVKSFVA